MKVVPYLEVDFFEHNTQLNAELWKEFLDTCNLQEAPWIKHIIHRITSHMSLSDKDTFYDIIHKDEKYNLVHEYVQNQLEMIQDQNQDFYQRISYSFEQRHTPQEWIAWLNDWNFSVQDGYRIQCVVGNILSHMNSQQKREIRELLSQNERYNDVIEYVDAVISFTVDLNEKNVSEYTIDELQALDLTNLCVRIMYQIQDIDISKLTVDQVRNGFSVDIISKLSPVQLLQITPEQWNVLLDRLVDFSLEQLNHVNCGIHIHQIE